MICHSHLNGLLQLHNVFILPIHAYVYCQCTQYMFRNFISLTTYSTFRCWSSTFPIYTISCCRENFGGRYRNAHCRSKLSEPSNSQCILFISPLSVLTYYAYITPFGCTNTLCVDFGHTPLVKLPIFSDAIWFPSLNAGECCFSYEECFICK